MSAVILHDEIVHYEVLGRGRPLVFMHGWVGSWRYWIPTMQSASTAFRAYAIDLWGFGDSAKNPSKYSLPSQVELLESFMDKLGIARIALIGHGLGSYVAIEFSIKNPNLVDRLMAVSFPLDGQPLNPRLQSSNPSELAEWLLSKAPESEAARQEAMKADLQAISTSYVLSQKLQPATLFPRLNTPCLFVTGQNDPLITSPDSDDLTPLPDHTHHILFEGSGHFPMLDESNKFNRLLVDFLALSPGVSPRQLQLKEEWKRRVR